MAAAALVAKRQGFVDDNNNGNFCDNNNDGFGCNSNWDNWGRWVALVVIIAFFLILAFLLSCLANRRRRRLGRTPMMGTGWIPYAGHQGFYQPPPYGQHNQPQNNYSGNDAYAAPPKYAGPVDPQPTGTTFTGSPGYYGNHNNIELQQPATAYQQPQREDEYVYEAPTRAPPAKGEKA